MPAPRRPTTMPPPCWKRPSRSRRISPLRTPRSRRSLRPSSGARPRRGLGRERVPSVAFATHSSRAARKNGKANSYTAATTQPKEDAMHVMIAALSASTSRRTMELAALLGLVGGLLLAAVAVRPSFQKVGLLLGGLLLALTFLLLIVAWHFGVNPYHRCSPAQPQRCLGPPSHRPALAR